LLALKADPVSERGRCVGNRTRGLNCSCQRKKNSRGQYAFEVAKNDRLKTILRTFRPIKHRTLMHYAAENGNLALVQWIINNKFGNAVTAWDRDHNAPLHFASARGYYDICKALLIAGADKTIYNRGKQLPMDVAKTEEIRQLIENYEHHRYVNVDGSPAEADATAAAATATPLAHADAPEHADDDDTPADDLMSAKATELPPGVDQAALAADPFEAFVSERAVRLALSSHTMRT
jgi:hypothetical protein